MLLLDFFCSFILNSPLFHCFVWCPLPYPLLCPFICLLLYLLLCLFLCPLLFLILDPSLFHCLVICLLLFLVLDPPLFFCHLICPLLFFVILLFACFGYIYNFSLTSLCFCFLLQNIQLFYHCFLCSVYLFFLDHHFLKHLNNIC